MNASWPATQWTLICRAGSLPPAERSEALGRLVAIYLEPIQATLARILTGRGVPAARARQWAEELAANFVADRWLQGDMLGRLDRGGPARFKTFLYKSLADFAVDALRASAREQAALRTSAERAARGASAGRDAGGEAAGPFAEAVRSFERDLALADLREAFLEARRWCEERGWQETFRRFAAAFVGGDGGAGSGALPERTFRDRCAKIRVRINEAYRRRVAASCLSDDEVDREIAHLDGLLLELDGAKWAAWFEGASR